MNQLLFPDISKFFVIENKAVNVKKTGRIKKKENE